MIIKEIQNIFEFISFLDSNKKDYIGKYLPICEELKKLIGQSSLPIDRDYALSFVESFLVHHFIALTEEADEQGMKLN